MEEAKDKFIQSEINITDKKISKTEFRVHPSDEMINQLIAEYIILDCQAFNVELNGYGSLKCAGHTLNLCVKNILETEGKFKTYYRNVFQSLVIFKDRKKRD